MDCQTLLAKYDFLNDSKLLDFKDKLPQQDRTQFQALIDKGKLVARTLLQAVVSAANTASRSMATAIVMNWESWLYFSGFPNDVQNTVEYLPLETSLLNKKTGKSFCTH